MPTNSTNSANRPTSRLGVWQIRLMNLARVALGALAAIAIGAPAAQAATRVAGEPAKPIAYKSSALEQSFEGQFGAATPTINFFAMDPARIEQVKSANAGKFRKATQIGLMQSAADEAFDNANLNLQWRTVASGNVVAQFKARSPGATATRVGLKISGLPADAFIRMAGSDDPYTVVHAASTNEVLSSLDGSGRYWTPMTEGDTQLIEVVLPSAPDNSVAFNVDAISHIFASPRDAFKGAFATKAASGTCYRDPVCNSETQASINTKNATAHMVFQSGGGSFVCTGTLLNDTVSTSQIPYFYSANHCIGTQTEASTLTTYWNYENASCGAPNISRTNPVVTAVQGGATLLYANEPSDVLLLQLRGTVPASAYFAGWDSSSISGSASATVFHHPGGDPKKVSSGVTISTPFTNVQMNTGVGSFINFAYLSSSTEGGSSGSGLFSTSGGNYFFRGGLLGGDALCSNTGDINNALNRDVYSRFDQAYPLLKQWLDPTPALAPLSKRGGIDLDGNNKSVLLVTSTAGLTQAGRLTNGTFVWSSSTILNPGQNFRMLGAVDFGGTGKSDLAALQTTPLNASGQGDARLFRNFDIASGGSSLRLVKPAWDVQAVGDLDGDGFGDLVWRFQGQSPNIDDQGVSYIWFTDGTGVTQVRKRGGAPLTWKLLGAADLNGDNAADMIYVSPDNVIRVLMATPSRTCANLSGGTIPVGSAAIKLADFTGNRRGDILARNSTTGAITIISLDARGLTLPPYTGAADDPNASCTGSSLSVTQSAVYTFNTIPPANWTVFATGDFDGDGIFDIVFMQPDRTLTMWKMGANGAQPTVTNVGSAPANFSPFPLQ